MAVGHAQVDPLACGRDAADVWEHADSGTLDEHERSCPHCTSARADHDGLSGLVARMAAEPVHPPPSVLEQVVGAVVADLRPHELLTIGPDAWLGRPAAESALRHVVDSMDGLRARRCRVEQERGAEPATVWVTVSVVARFGVDLASVTARVRQMIISAGARTLGVPVAGVDIHVEDVWTDPAPEQPTEQTSGQTGAAR
ncbi:Asp23/Gls24 family envelope stress response protein [Pseudonocardia phyllosphaerae]|uniref:Asp23/Gls24 family envelope stress response protein n=1 Tax=Pseudonocardia phyllosphaerae TaxID=3390502 RepID=UPI00397DF05B